MGMTIICKTTEAPTSDFAKRNGIAGERGGQGVVLYYIYILLTDC